MNNIDVIILAGGRGTRLQEVVSDRPKPMAEINGRPFLDMLLGYLKGFGLNRFILCIGHMSDYIENYYKEDISVLISREIKTLGTGGAVRNAEKMINSSPFLVMNGDSFCPLDLNKFIGFHRQKKALASIALVTSDDTQDFGKITIDDSGRIIRFEEKSTGEGKSSINAGIYLFNRVLIDSIPPAIPYSLEYDLFPRLVGKEFYGFITDGNLIDIGTPERYELAKKFFKDIR